MRRKVAPSILLCGSPKQILGISKQFVVDGIKKSHSCHDHSVHCKVPEEMKKREKESRNLSGETTQSHRNQENILPS